ncbi:MAG TPA: zinc-dependent alcohol dehydrogenase, partial [candidate division Zixibacteria bacterium]|nr:zinc-dependent alcohol dehydrogenase [candidate division Zixibacteria bacterium]
KAARIHRYDEPLKLEEIPRPTPRAGQVLIEIIASGVCHTDLHACAGHMSGSPTLPFVPGHEIVGRVVEIGPEIRTTRVGDLVGVASLHWACGECEFCLSGREALCPKLISTGYDVDGGFAEFTVAPAEFVAHLPGGIDPYKMAPVLCAGVTTYKALKATDASPGQWVVISGVGGLGHLAIQYARALGYRVAAVDIAADKLALAERVGAEFVVNAATDNAIARIHEEIGGAHAVVVTAAAAAAFRTGVGMLRRGGTCVLCGLPPGDFPLPIKDVVLAGQTVRGSIIGTRQDLDEAIDFVITHNLHVEIQKRRLDEINTIFAELESGAVTGRVVLDLS